MAEKKAFENKGFQTFKGSWPWIRSYCIPLCLTRRPLPTC